MDDSQLPAALVERRRSLKDELTRLDARIASRRRAIEDAEAKDIDVPIEEYHALSAMLEQSAWTVDLIKDMERDTMVELYKMREAEAEVAFKPREPREGDVEIELEPAPDGLAEKSLEEIMFVLRTKQRWTWQQIVDWLMANGVKRPKGGADWHTSAAYAIHKKGFAPDRA